MITKTTRISTGDGEGGGGWARRGGSDGSERRTRAKPCRLQTAFREGDRANGRGDRCEETEQSDTTEMGLHRAAEPMSTLVGRRGQLTGDREKQVVGRGL